MTVPSHDAAAIDPTADVDRAWEQVDEFRMPGITGRVVPLDPATFTAHLRSVGFDGVRIDVMRCGPHRFERTAEDVEAATSRQILTTVFGSGSVTGVIGSQTFSCRAGDVMVYDTAHPVQALHEAPLRMLRCAIDADRLPPYVLDGPPFPIGVIARTALVNSFIAFVSALVSDGPSGPRSPQLVQALADLEVEVLAEVRGVLAHEPGPAGLRYRIEEHVMRHLEDPALAPGSIARDLGVSLRSVHSAFEGEAITVARLIRDRRLDSVATELQERSGTVSFSDLAMRHGFGSRDQLARAFRTRFGLTMRDYRFAATAG